MAPSRSFRLFQIIGLLVLATMLVQGLAMTDEMAAELLPPDTPGWVLLFGDVLVGLGFCLFGVAFWWCTSRGPMERAPRILFALLAFQALLGFALWTDLLYLLAAELPFVLPERLARRWMVAVAGVAILATLQLFASDEIVVMQGTEDLSKGLAALITLVTVLINQGFAFCVGYIAATERRSRDDLARVNAELRATQELLADSTRMAERAQISRELHDTLGHHLTVLSLNLELAKQVSGEKATEPIRESQEVTRLLLGDVREVVSTLREDRAIDLRHALETLAAGTPGPRVHLSFAEGLEITDPAQAHALFRCAQEAITNAARHARARNLWIEVFRDGDGVALRARDDGRGTVEVHPGHGLTGMRERVEGAGGRFAVDSRPGAGFALTAWLPGPAGWP